MEPENSKTQFRDSEEPLEIEPKELTKFEKDQIEKSKIRHKEGIVKPQVIMGREFKGTSFISDPAKIIFKDFDVGRMHQQIIQMTNVSLSFNSFKLLEINDSIKDFFNIVYKPSGRIGAGISAPILVQFIPQVNEDIFGYLPLLSETGPVNVPIECTSKKAIVTVDDPIVDFKKVIYGGSLKKQLKFTNAGALQTEIVFKNLKGTHLGQKYDASSSRGSSVSRGRSVNLDEEEDAKGVDVEEEKIMEQVKFQKTAIIGGYSSITITFEYTPSEVASLDFDMVAYFENYLHSPPIPIKLQGECIEVPIYIEKPLYDFEICLPHHIYRERIVFFNRGKTAMKVQIEAPKETKKFFEFNPSLGYIQADSKFEIWVKLIAEPDLLTMCAKFSTGENVLTIPFKLIGADQVLPVEFDIKVKMTTDKIQFQPSTLNFGKCYQNTSVSKILKIQNFSDLPQELMFFPIPKNIKIMPDLVPLKLLPKETISVDVSYQGRENLVEEAEMRCKIVTGNLAARDTKLSYRAETVRCPLQFSNHKIQLPAIQVNEKCDLNITVTNTSKNNTYVFEFFLPYFEICGLKMTPMVQQLAPGKSVDVILSYDSFFKKLGPYTMEELIEKYEKDPNKNFAYRMKMKEEEKLRQAEEEKKKEEDTKGKKGAKAPEKKDVKKPGKLTKQQEKELEEETRRQQELEAQREEEERQKRLELERNFDVAGELKKLGGKLYEFGNKDDKNFNQQYEWILPCYFSQKVGDDVGEPNVCYLEVSTVTVNKRLVVNRDLIDFGEMAVGFRKVEELQLTNCGDQIADLKMEMLPLFGGFSIIGALRSVGVGKVKGILVQFEPHAQQYFEETLKIYTKTSSVSVKLKGSGVNPEVKLTPESGLLNTGGVLLGDYVEKTFSITNLSNFQLSFKLVSKAKGIQNKLGSQVFSFIPSEGKIPAHKELEVKVVFRPDRVSENFYEVITIDVPHQKDEKSLFLAGMCFPRQAWVTLYKPFVFPNLKELQKKELENPLDFVTVKDTDTVFGCGNNKVILEFKKMANKSDRDDECFYKKISIGSSKLLDPKAEKATTYEVTMPKEEKGAVYFTCDSLKDNVPAGGSKVVTFTFKPPQPDAFVGDIEVMQGIGQWIEQKAEIKIAGGLARQGFSEQFSIEVVLRAYIDQI